MQLNSLFTVLLLWQLVAVLFAFRKTDTSTLSYALSRSHYNVVSLAKYGRNGLIHTTSSLLQQDQRATVAHCTSTQSTTRTFAMHPQRPMLQSIDESKFNILQRVATWPKRKTEAMKDFFKSNLPMLRFLWPDDSPRLKLFLVLSMIFMFFGKWFNLKVPFIMQRSIDMMSKNPNGPFRDVAISFIIYGIARAMSTVCAEIKTCLFVHVSQNVLRKFANQIFSHLHALDSSFHLATPSGVISVAYVRAVRGFQTMLFQLVFSVAPTFLELAMVSQVMYKKFDPIFALVTLITFTSYLIFTVWLTQWRVHLRQELVDVDNARNGFFIDSILNHEIVKLFNNEQKERDRFDGYLSKLQQLSIDSTVAIAWLNFGQACMFSIGLTTNLLIAYDRVRRGFMSLGDLIAVNAMLLQLAVPFNFIGYTYQELRQSFVDMGYIREIIAGREPQVADQKHALSLDDIAPRNGPSSIEFRNVTFQYADHGDVHQLQNVSFTISPGQSVAIVGPSGSGKSTTLKLITRMIEPLSGDILVDNVSTKDVTRASVLSRIAVVPQDCSLFDDTIEYNIRYGAVNASVEALEKAISQANLKTTIDKLPEGLRTVVGERGAKLSGGERQKVSIARAMLRDPSLILCDEVTASVDAFAEREIVETLLSATAERTTITVAHRLSSIAHSDIILVMNKGALVEMGNHETLLTKNQGLYRSMWLAQNLMDDRGHPQLAADHHHHSSSSSSSSSNNNNSHRDSSSGDSPPQSISDEEIAERKNANKNSGHYSNIHFGDYSNTDTGTSSDEKRSDDFLTEILPYQKHKSASTNSNNNANSINNNSDNNSSNNNSDDNSEKDTISNTTTATNTAAEVPFFLNIVATENEYSTDAESSSSRNQHDSNSVLVDFDTDNILLDDKHHDHHHHTSHSDDHNTRENSAADPFIEEFFADEQGF